MHVGLDGRGVHDIHYSPNSDSRLFTSRQAKKGSIFQETVLVADTRVEVILGMPLLTLSSCNNVTFGVEVM